MNWISDFQNVNYFAVLVASIASYVLGFAWYHWAVFGKAWANALGMTKEQADHTEGLGNAFAVSLVSGLSKALCIAFLMQALNITDALGGAAFGAIISAVYTATSMGYYNGFARISSRFTLINALHSVIELGLIGGLIGMVS